MYYKNATADGIQEVCEGNQLPSLVAKLPGDSDVPLPPNPLLEEQAVGTGHHHHQAGMVIEARGRNDKRYRPYGGRENYAKGGGGGVLSDSGGGGRKYYKPRQQQPHAQGDYNIYDYDDYREYPLENPRLPIQYPSNQDYFYHEVSKQRSRNRGHPVSGQSDRTWSDTATPDSPRDRETNPRPPLAKKYPTHDHTPTPSSRPSTQAPTTHVPTPAHKASSQPAEPLRTGSKSGIHMI